MTVLLLHGLVRRGAPLPDDAVPHLRVDACNLIALATEAPEGFHEAEPEASLAAAVRHHELLSAYALQGDVLPVRLGSAFSGADSLSAALASRRAAFAAGLDRLTGKVEYLLSLAVAPTPLEIGGPAPHASGRSFLAEKRAARDRLRGLAARRQALLGEIPGLLAPVTSDCRPIPVQGRDDLARFSCLVERGEQPGLLRAARALGTRAGTLGLGLTLRGPGPCYGVTADDRTDAVSGGAANQWKAKQGHG